MIYCLRAFQLVVAEHMPVVLADSKLREDTAIDLL